MSETTTNYDLTKPDVGSTGWGEDVNTNFDTIDTLLKENADAILAGIFTNLTATGTATFPSVKLTAGDINPTNLISNGDFEAWSAGTAVAPDGWALSGAGSTVAREASIIKLGTYSLKVTRNGSDCYCGKEVHAERGIAYWKGRTVTFGCWVYATVATRAYIYLYDGVGTTSISHTGDSTWQWLTITRIIDSSANRVRIQCQVQGGDTSAYFDGAMCVEGSSAFAFSDKPAGTITGTWTPVYQGTTGTIGSTSYSKQFGVYSKSGNIVTVSGYVALTNNGDWTGNVIISGLPFAGANMPDALHPAGTGSVASSNITYDGQLVPYVADNSTNIKIFLQKTATGISLLDASGVPDNGAFHFSITYIAA